jgi:hypothetical protein
LNSLMYQVGVVLVFGITLTAVVPCEAAC